jgi:hypothetical protein
MVAGIFLVFTLACVKKPIEKKPITGMPTSITKENFLVDPFGYKPTIKNFSTQLFPQYKLQIYSIKNIHNPQVSDTIYRFYRKKSELFIYKTTQGRELFFAANIVDGKVVLKNGVKVGITREEFFNGFTNLKQTPEDSVRLGSKRSTTMFNFVFKNNRLQAIKINNYID